VVRVAPMRAAGPTCSSAAAEVAAAGDALAAREMPTVTLRPGW
jgi:hypothetical protein